ncbi:MAG: OmpA family protein [Acidobacteria bacterium]|nr:OmpA family protein [Acidobacteriota bacterium]
MRLNHVGTLRSFVATLLLTLVLAPLTFAQGSGTTPSTSNARTNVAAGQKMKVKGVVMRRDADTFIVRDQSGAETVVLLSDQTSVKTKGGAFGGGTSFGQTAILRGLNLEVEGRGDSSGRLVAEKIRFSDRDLRTAKAVEANVTPVENRVGTAEGRIGQVEQNAQRMSGQLDELAAVSNAASGGAVAAQEAANKAVEGVRVANDRVSALDDYTAQQSLNVNFKLRSAALTPEAKRTLDEVAKYSQEAKGFMFEVTGYAYDFRGKEANRQLSQQRAESVVRYLVETHRVPLRRIITPYGYGAAPQPIAENTTREGREQNRRAEVRVLVNRGLAQPATEMNPSKVTSATPPQ